MIKHISFDFWNTIGQPCPEYSRARNSFLANRCDITPEEAARRYLGVKKVLDNDTGIQISHCDALAMLEAVFPGISAEEMDSQLVELFNLHPPTIDPNLVRYLCVLHQTGMSISIGSNTVILRGQTIRERLLGNIPFTFTLFSDEVDVAKPAFSFFELMKHGACTYNPNVRDVSNILHVGDSIACDIAGGQRAGIRTAYTPDATQTLSTMLSLGL